MKFISDSLSVNEHGRLAVGGADVSELAEKYGTPLFIMDEGEIRKNCREYVSSLKKHYGGNFLVLYASKAFCAKYMYKIIEDEGLGADVVSGGELFTALSAGFPADRIYFHGNNKTESEIRFAIESKIGGFVVDNREELYLIDKLSKDYGTKTRISFRIKPGIDAHTHEFIKTGQIDSKFGVALENGEAYELISEAVKLENVSVCGLHCHIGSQIFEKEPFEHAAEVMMKFISKIQSTLPCKIEELNLGGGFGIKYTEKDAPNSIDSMTETFCEAIKKSARQYGIELPRLLIEPGRSIVASSGLTVYRVGSVKEIKNIRTYVSVDGGMTDNPRYALYGAEYEMLLPERPLDEKDTVVTVAGRNCESGDLLGRDIALPKVKNGELLAVLATGAYNYSMASNYNRVPRPPVVMVKDGADKLIVKRETYSDLTANDIL